MQDFQDNVLDRLQVAGLCKIKRYSEIVPYRYRGEYGERRQHRLRQRQDNAEENRIFTGSINLRRFEQGFGNRFIVGIQDDNIPEP